MALAGGMLTLLDLLACFLRLGFLNMLKAHLNHKTVRAQIVDKAAVNGSGADSAIWRHFLSAKNDCLEERPFSEESTPIDTVWAFCSRAHRLYRELPALGTRTFLEFRKVNETDRFPAKIYGATKWLTYAQVEAKAKAFGSALRELGMVPQTFGPNETFESDPGANTILLYEDTCAEWFIAAQGAHSQAIAVATAYATLGVESVQQAVDEGGVETILCNRTNVTKLLEFKEKGHMKTLKNIIYTDLNIPQQERQKKLPSSANVKVHCFDDLIQSAPPREITPPRPHHCAVLMYTSGSTGKPKGIVCLHKQLVSLMGALQKQINLQEHESLIGYLPLAHIFEMQMEFFAFGFGGTIGYADTKTLTGGPMKCMQEIDGQLVPKGALEEFRPTIMGAVPKVWEVIKSGAEAKIAAGGPAKVQLFNTALSVKKSAIVQGRPTPLWDLVVFNKFKTIVGGRLRLAVSGGGAIQPSVQEWVRAVFGCPLVQGYGLTETCAGLTVQMPDDWRTGVCGSPLPTCDVLLASCPDITDCVSKPYMTDDTVHHIDAETTIAVKGRGEVWTKGNNVTLGYYKMPAQTKEAWTDDGWFKTGDIAVMLPDGSLKIVDRKKNLAKLKGGEYVALEKMNLALKTASFVHKDSGGVCVFADDTIDRPIALVQIIDDVIKEKAAALGISGSIEEICNNDAMRKKIKEEINAVGKSQGCTGVLEQLSDVTLLHEGRAWSPDDGTLTATLKLVPNAIKAKCLADITAMKKRVGATM